MSIALHHPLPRGLAVAPALVLALLPVWTAYADQPFDEGDGTAIRTRVGSVVVQDLDP